MSRYRMDPTLEQESAMQRHCDNARFIWNLALEQNKYYRTGGRRLSAPNHNERSRQLTQARAENEWLREGSATVQQQALRDYDQAMQGFFNHTHGLPKWRKVGKNEGFRIVHFKATHVRALNKHFAEVMIPKIGWVRFRYSREMDFTNVRSYRVTLNPAGQWHIAFVAIPTPITGPGTRTSVGIDVGIVHALALNNGEFYDFATDPRLNKRIKGLQRAMARAKRNSNRRKALRLKFARAQLKKANRRKDFIEKRTTDVAKRFDYIGIEDLRIKDMTKSAKGTLENPGRNVAQKSGLNREILDHAWGMIFTRLEQKAPGRVTRVPAKGTSTECNECYYDDKRNRESQAIFKCLRCGLTMNADTKSGITIDIRASTAGHAGKGQSSRVRFNARRGASASLKREPQVTLLA